MPPEVSGPALPQQGCWEHGAGRTAFVNLSDEHWDRVTGFPIGPVELLFPASATERDEVLTKGMHFAFAS